MPLPTITGRSFSGLAAKVRRKPAPSPTPMTCKVNCSAVKRLGPVDEKRCKAERATLLSPSKTADHDAQKTHSGSSVGPLDRSAAKKSAAPTSPAHRSDRAATAVSASDARVNSGLSG